MNSNQYRVEARKTENARFVYHRLLATNYNDSRILHGTLGLSSEAGELCDILKKAYCGGKFTIEESHSRIVDECGDCLWYIDLILDACGATIEEAMEWNIDKLRKRAAEKSINDREKRQ